MNGERFQELLDGQTPASDAARNELRQLTVDYPWFQAAHVLLAQMDHSSGHVEYDVHLKRAAVHVTEREALFNLLMRPGLRKTVSAFEEAVDQQVDEEVLPHPAGEAESPSTPPKAEATSFSGSEPLDLQEHDASSDALLEPAVDENEVAAEASEEAGEDSVKGIDLGEHPAPPLVKASHYDDLEREILLEAISSSIEQEVSGLELDEAELDEGSTSAEHGEAPKQLEGAAQAAKEEPSRDVPTPGEVSGKSAYAQWLLSHRKGTAQEGGADQTASASTSPSQKVEDKKAKERNLIETFIKNDPKISRGKAEMFSTENLAKLSVVEDESFVTETMAQIFAKQGNLKKAMKAYRTLSLKYPEKSVYFANQIKKLQELR